MTRKLFVAFVLMLSLIGCAHRHVDLSADPQTAVERARARSLPFAMQASYTVHIRSAKGVATTRGLMILSRPASFRVEVMGAMGTPLVSAISDGRGLAVYNGQIPAFYRTDNAVAALAALSGGAVRLDDALDLLSGTLPLRDAPVLKAETTEAGVAITLQGREDVLVDALIDPDSGLMRTVGVRRGDEPPLLSLTYGEAVKVGKTKMPRSVSLDVPSLDLSVEITVSGWEELGVVPDAFSTAAPGSMTALDLVAAVNEAIEKRSAAQQDARPEP